ncbi:hypothetical protein PENSPDRAFT_694843 [Peniophora sp. CONT]|nr:hypothetical protein PENSPDRAFT_694843 [Peniophora sp. CONT]
MSDFEEDPELAQDNDSDGEDSGQDAISSADEQEEFDVGPPAGFAAQHGWEDSDSDEPGSPVQIGWEGGSESSDGVGWGRDDLGEKASRQDAVGWGNVSVGPVPHDLDVGVALPGRMRASAPDSSNNLPAGQMFLFAEVLDMLVPPIDAIPAGNFWTPLSVGGQAIRDITNLQQVCQLWDVTITGIGSIWGAFVPAARDPAELTIALERARDAHIRLLYRLTIPKAVTDELLPRANAVYAGRDCPWRNFARILQTRLPDLKVLILHPSTDGMPRSPLRLYDVPLDAPYLLICDVWGPLLLIAPRLQRLGLRFCTPEQISRTFAGLADVPLQHLVLEQIREENGVDLTALMRGVCAIRLRFLRIAAGATQTTGLLAVGERVSCPDLEIFDVAGPVWLAAHKVCVAKIFNAEVEELFWMLLGMSGVQTLHVRFRLEWSLIASRPRILPPHDIGLPVALPCAKKILLAGVMSEDTLELLNGVSAPALENLTVFCDMPPAPEHDILRATRVSIQNALVAAQATAANNAASVVYAILDADRTLRDAGHYTMGRKFTRIPDFASLWGQAETTTWERADSVARLAMQALDEAFAQPPEVHNGFLLRRVTQAVLTAAGVGDPLADDVEIQMSPGRSSVHFIALVRRGTCVLDFAMANTRTNEWATSRWHNFTRTDSTTFGVARMLFGLAVLKPITMRVTGDPLGSLPGGYGVADAMMLRDVLRSYDRVVLLHLDYSWINRSRYHLLSALGDATTLPSLQGMVVVCAPFLQSPVGEYVNGQYLGPRDDRPYQAVSALVNMLSARSEGGNTLEELTLEGSFCLSEEDGRTAEDVVGQLVTKDVRCERPGGAEWCAICSWRY